MRGRGPAKGAPNAGRPPSAIREAYRLAAADRLAFVSSVIDGDPMVKMRDAEGVETGATVSAPIGDRLRAWEALNKYGLGTTVTETDGQGNDAPRLVLVVQYAPLQPPPASQQVIGSLAWSETR
jgi:hypothetical protein